jgi:hypothetical protein
MQQIKNLQFKSIALIFIFHFSFFIFNSLKAQDSSHIRISLLTCTPGDELYSTFGHSALRITDSLPSPMSDIVFNYGTFNFDSDFYIKFIRGKLLYYVSAENFEDFKNMYQTTNRGITEQLLNFTPKEKIEIEDALYDNLKDENKYYKYDFFYDNCTTRLRDVIIRYKDPRPTFNHVMPKGTTFRQAIHQYLNKNGKYWSKLGIDLLLGEPIDSVMTSEESQFLPDNLMKTLENSNANHQLVSSTTNLYPFNPNNNEDPFFTPMRLFSFLFLFIVLLGFSTNKTVKSFIQGFDGLLFFLTGALGILCIIMWTWTDHTECKNNFNLLWAWPINVIVAFFVNSKKDWVKKYFGFTAIALTILLFAWFFLPQQMNNALFPIVLLLIYRSAYKYLTLSNPQL